MSPRATGTASQAARERMDAARALLARPLLTAAHPEELALVRLHAPALRSTFKTVLGYSLIVESTFARLTKGPVSPDGPARPARRPDSSTFTPPTYTHLALLAAALLAPGTGEQTLISVTAIGHLVGWGVLAETDGTATGWGERRDEALLTIHRAALPHLLARPLSGMSHPDDLLAADPQLADQPRRSLRRKLVENPLVRREDLTDAERDVLSRERSELTRVLGENFGLTVEVRAEGALAYDSTGSLTDVAFPGSGTVKQAALLLLAELIDLRQPTAGTTASLDDGRTVPGGGVSWDEVDGALARLSARHRRAWGATLVDQPDRLREEVITLLTDLGLATVKGSGVVIHPAAARYRPQPHTAPATRAARRLADQPALDLTTDDALTSAEEEI